MAKDAGKGKSPTKNPVAQVKTPGRGSRDKRMRGSESRQSPTQIEKIAFIGRSTQSALGEIQRKARRGLLRKDK